MKVSSFKKGLRFLKMDPGKKRCEAFITTLLDAGEEKTIDFELFLQVLDFVRSG